MHLDNYTHLLYEPRNVHTNPTKLLQHPDVPRMASHQGVQRILHKVGATHQYGDPHQDNAPGKQMDTIT